MGMLQSLWRGLSTLLSPRVCRICGTTLTGTEEVMCLKCNLDLPRTSLHTQEFNQIHRRLGHRYAVDRAAGWYYYKKGTAYAQMLVDAKYGSLPRLDRRLATLYATEILGSGFFDGIDLMVPMPIHWSKRWTRGYNQTEEICRGIAQVTSLPYTAGIVARRSHGTQARHGRSQRQQSIAGTLALAHGALAKLGGKHVLLVDDIITSGATCSEALRVLWQARPAAVSVLVLGVTMEY